MKNTNIRMAVIALFLAGIMSVSAEEIRLTGKVISEDKNPLGSVSLRLKQRGLLALSDVTGKYVLAGEAAGVVTGKTRALQQPVVKLNGSFLEFSHNSKAAVSVYTLSGVCISKLNVINQKKIAVDDLFPMQGKNQSYLMSIDLNGCSIALRVVRCGNTWLLKNNNIQSGGTSDSGASAGGFTDTLIAEHEMMQTVAVPVGKAIADLPDIMMQSIVQQQTGGETTSKMVGDIVFSEASKTFKDPFTVSMSTALVNTEIRYTTDGTLPTATSLLYSKELSISQTTRLRAAAFSGNMLTGKPSSALYIMRSFDYTSEIPIIIMEGFGGGKPEDKYNFIELGFMTFEPLNGKSSFADKPSLSTRAGYHLRGQSSMMMFQQAPYRIELWDNSDNDTKYPVLGMPEGSDWALISPCTDNTLIRNVMVFEMGKAIGLSTVQYRFAEVFINQDGGPLELDDYEGIYALIQPIKNRKGTLDLKSLDTKDVAPSVISGGYIFKFDQMVQDSGMLKLECTGSKKMEGFGMGGKVDSTATCFADLELVEPANPNPQQIEWITSYIQEFHNALHAKPAGDWKKYVDVASFVNIHVVNEVTRNVDGWIRSHFMHKDRDKPIVAGPIWDYNFTTGNYATDLVGWHCEENRRGSNDWHLMMWKQPEFKSAFKMRYTELRKSVLADAAVDKLIDDVKKPINNVAQRNFTAWPMGKCMSSGGGGMGGMFSTPKITDSTWTGQVDSLKTWMKKRMKSLDSSVATLP